MEKYFKKADGHPGMSLKMWQTWDETAVEFKSNEREPNGGEKEPATPTGLEWKTGWISLN